MRVLRTFDYFSIDILARTLVAPFRQTTSSTGTLLARLLDSLISRGVGFVMRLVMIILGMIAAMLQLVFSGLVMIIWPLVPALPFVAAVCYALGVSIWQ